MGYVKSDIGYLLNKVNQSANNELARLLREAGVTDITPGLGRILFALWQKDEVKMNELAKETYLDRSTMTTMIDRLEKNSLVRRIPDPVDRRGILVKLTDTGFERKELYKQVSSLLNRKLLRGIDQEKLEITKKVLQQIFDNLQSQF